jgi:hypothetical protein
MISRDFNLVLQIQHTRRSYPQARKAARSGSQGEEEKKSQRGRNLERGSGALFRGG